VRDLKSVDKDGVQTWVVMARYHVFPSVKERSGIIRVDEFKQSCIMQPDENGTKGKGYTFLFKLYYMLS